MAMLYLGDHVAFWIFTITEIGFLVSSIVLAWVIGPKQPNKIKATIFECGQDPIGAAKDYKILGITRYFGYAVVFFALDAFAWVTLTAAMSINFTFDTIAIVSVYVFIILVGVGYFLSELKKLVR